MYVKTLLEGDHILWEDNDVYEPVRSDMTYGLLLQYLEVSHPCPLHSHPEIEQVYYIRSGQGIMTVDGEEQEVGPDTVIYVPPGAHHRLVPLEGEKNLTYLSICHYHEVSSAERAGC